MATTPGPSICNVPTGRYEPRSLLLVALCLGVSACGFARAQYPSKLIRILAPNPPDSQVVINPHLYARMAVDPIKDLQPAPVWSTPSYCWRPTRRCGLAAASASTCGRCPATLARWARMNTRPVSQDDVDVLVLGVGQQFVEAFFAAYA